MRLEGKAAVVTGSGHGIGRAIALRLAREGTDVVVNYSRSEAEAREIVAGAEAAGRLGFAVQADLRRANKPRRWVDEAAAGLDLLAILVNNASGGRVGAFTETTEEDRDRIAELNLKDAFFATRAFARHLIEAGRPCRVITISSLHKKIPLPGRRRAAPSGAESRSSTATWRTNSPGKGSPSTPSLRGRPQSTPALRY